MSFITKAFRPSGSSGSQNVEAQRIAQRQLNEQRAFQNEQRLAVRQREEKTQAAEEAQRRIRRANRGMLAYTEDEKVRGASGLKQALGG